MRVQGQGKSITDKRYGGDPLSDLVGNHSTIARQNGRPSGDKQSMEQSAGWMEYKDGDQTSVRGEASASSSAASHCAIYSITKPARDIAKSFAGRKELGGKG
jgi:hypothetical protein